MQKYKGESAQTKFFAGEKRQVQMKRTRTDLMYKALGQISNLTIDNVVYSVVTHDKDLMQQSCWASLGSLREVIIHNPENDFWQSWVEKNTAHIQSQSFIDILAALNELVLQTFSNKKVDEDTISELLRSAPTYKFPNKIKRQVMTTSDAILWQTGFCRHRVLILSMLIKSFFSNRDDIAIFNWRGELALNAIHTFVLVKNDTYVYLLEPSIKPSDATTSFQPLNLTVSEDIEQAIARYGRENIINIMQIYEIEEELPATQPLCT